LEVETEGIRHSPQRKKIRRGKTYKFLIFYEIIHYLLDVSEKLGEGEGGEPSALP
jgi:hypothetical protein